MPERQLVDGDHRHGLHVGDHHRPARALTPCHFEGLDDLAQRILGSRAEVAKTATPFDWTFTRRELNALLDRLGQRGRLTPAA
jgi:hypothetical protein